MRSHPLWCPALVALVFASTTTGIVRRGNAGDEANARVVAGFGSSVCLGAGDEVKLGGYIGRLKMLLDPRGWEVVNASRRGDDTLKIQQRWEPPRSAASILEPNSGYLLPHRPRYVILGLSLNNDGIRHSTDQETERVCAQFLERLSALVKRCQAEHIKVIVAGCYAHNGFSPAHYAATKRTNLAINSWDVPSINLLGTIDDGYGHWANGYSSDAGHPSAAGYQEMFFAIVPTLFDALTAGKPRPQLRSSERGVAVPPTPRHRFEFNVTEPMHSFAMSGEVRLHGDGNIGQIIVEQSILPRANCAVDQTPHSHNTESDTVRVCRRIRANGSQLTYRLSELQAKHAETKTVDEQWHWFTLSHCHARGETSLYVDGQLKEVAREYLVPIRFEFATSAVGDYRNWIIHRSALDNLQVQTLHDSQLVQSSLELYAPLDDAEFIVGCGITNLAQSLSQANVVRPKWTLPCNPVSDRGLRPTIFLLQLHGHQKCQSFPVSHLLR